MTNIRPVRLDRYTRGDYSVGASTLKQVLWFFIGAPIVRCEWVPFSGLRVALLRLFGARIGVGVRIKPGFRVKFPWRLQVGNHVWLSNAWIDNLAPVTLEDHVCISQEAYLCTGNHNWKREDFQLLTSPILVESGAWVGARAVVGPGVTIKQGAILALGAVATRSLDAMTIYAGNPAEKVAPRTIDSTPS